MNQSTSALTESQLHLAVEKLRSQHSNTLDLYKAVAALLFFHYDSTPTTNRMYQLVRKGSMSAPSEALRLFWQELRDRSQVRMEHADIPQNLKQSAGVLMAQLWEEGLAQALQTTEHNNQTIYTHIALAEQAKGLAIDESKKMQNALLIAQQQLKKQDEDIEELEKEAQKQQLQVASQAQQIKNVFEQKENLKAQHISALLTQKQQIALSEQRAAEMEKYARLEIERVRQDAVKAQKIEQAQLSEQKQKNQALQLQLQEQLKTHVALQQKQHYLEKQFEEKEKQYFQIEQQNQELRTLLHQLQQLQIPSQIMRTPSRLSQLRNKTSE